MRKLNSLPPMLLVGVELNVKHWLWVLVGRWNCLDYTSACVGLFLVKLYVISVSQ